MDRGHIVEDDTKEAFFANPRSERAQPVPGEDPAALTNGRVPRRSGPCPQRAPSNPPGCTHGPDIQGRDR